MYPLHENQYFTVNACLHEKNVELVLVSKLMLFVKVWNSSTLFQHSILNMLLFPLNIFPQQLLKGKIGKFLTPTQRAPSLSPFSQFTAEL